MSTHQFNVAALMTSLDSARESRGLSWREVARQTSLQPALFTRMSKGKHPNADHLVTLLAWLDMPHDWFTVEAALSPADELDRESSRNRDLVTH